MRFYIPFILFFILSLLLWKGLRMEVALPLNTVENNDLMSPESQAFEDSQTFQTIQASQKSKIVQMKSDLNTNQEAQDKEAQDIYPFAQREHDFLFNKIIRELRCVVCQNQTLADSNSTTAINIKKLIYTAVVKNHREQEIIKFVIARYGESILYQPPFNTSTWILWAGPGFLLILSFIFIVKSINLKLMTVSVFNLKFLKKCVLKDL